MISCLKMPVMLRPGVICLTKILRHGRIFTAKTMYFPRSLQSFNVFRNKVRYASVLRNTQLLPFHYWVSTERNQAHFCTVRET